MIFLRTMRLLLRPLAHMLFKLEICDFDKIPTTGGCIVVTNHLGRLDAILGFILADRPDVIMMIAEKYQKYWVWRCLVKRLNAIWLNRYEADFQALRTAQRQLTQGGVLAMAPEGTRSRTEALQPGKPGAAYLAARAGVPIVPVALFGTEDRVVKATLRRRRRPNITIRVGDPFTLPPMDRKDREAYLARYTDEIMCHIAILLPEKYHGVYADHPRLQELRREAEQGVESRGAGEQVSRGGK